jgi:WS/DGAT/MGAT family acyltransferase
VNCQDEEYSMTQGPDPSQVTRWQALASWGRQHHLNELETAMWRSERHPQQSSTIATLMLLEEAPDWQRLVAAHEWATRLVLRARQRLVEPLVPTGPPAWSLDPHFAIGYHLRRQQLSRRNTMADLLELVGALLMTPFDRSRPLWEATLIEGLEGGRAAYLLKLHHSLTDGLGAVQLMSQLQSPSAEHVVEKPVSTDVLERGPDAQQVTIDGALGMVAGLPTAATGAARLASTLVRHPLHSLGGGMRYAASLRRTLTPRTQGGSPLLAARDGRLWVLGELQCPLPELRRAGRVAGGSVNDAYLAALLGGLRRYHEHFGVPVDELPLTLPVSLRRSDDPLGGNRFAGAMIAGPVGVEDPAERIAVLRGLVLNVTNEVALDSFSVLTPVVNRLPSAVGAAAMRLGARNDLAASNVPGIPERRYLAGAAIERYIPFGPLPGVAMMSVLGSYAGECSIGLTMDAAAVTDPVLMIQCMRQGFDEVRSLADGS